jgi:methylenetetrahydrofolate dehydrogenase (NADP+)/methenyltetrahydrofolate cyclohydrolase
MAARIIDGNAVAARVRERVAREVEALDVRPGLATILVGDDPASAIYVRMKREDSARVGIESFHHEPGGDVAPQELSELIRSLNADERVHGILLQLPLPAHFDQDEFIPLIDPAKDVDGLTATNAGLLMQGHEALVPCTPAGVMELLADAEAQLDGARAVVLGRSILVGKPLAQLLLAANATVTHCHSRTRDLRAVCREAEVLIAAVGSPRLVTADMVREGAVVIDVGTSRGDDGLVGDVDFEGVSEKARAITPVPGGVGPMTRAMLLANTLKAARSGSAVAAGAGPGGTRSQPGSTASSSSSAERGSTP